MPAFSTLLPQSALQMLGYHCPLFVAIEIYELYNLRNGGYTPELQLILTDPVDNNQSDFNPCTAS